MSYGGTLGAVGTGTLSEIYNHYSEDGKTLVNGTTTLDLLQPATAEVHEISHLTMTGKHTGSTNIDLTLVGGPRTIRAATPRTKDTLRRPTTARPSPGRLPD